MGQGEDDMVMITGEKPRLLESQPALGLEIGALGTRPMAAGVVPDAGHVAIRTSLDMPPESCGAALHDGTRGAPHVAGQRMSAFIVGIARTEDLLQGQESHAVPQHSDCEKRVLPYFIKPWPAFPAPRG